MEMNVASKTIAEMAAIADTLENQYIREWKNAGKPVIGYFCASFPQEIVTAAGMLPLRLRATGSTGTELSDACFSSINCSFVRHCYNQALKGEMDFLDGVIILNSCDNIRRVYDHWSRQMTTSFVRMMGIPKKATEAQVAWFRDEINMIKDQLQEHFQVTITDDELRQAIQSHNRTRQLQRKLYELRRQEAPPITGADTLRVTVAGTAIPPERYQELLSEVISELENTQGIDDYSVRLMIMGSELYDPGYIEIIESQGGLIVTDSLCWGSRMFWHDIDENAEDPVTALARYYVAERPSCPRIFGKYEERSQFVQDMIRDFTIDGVIFERLAFCDIWGFEQFSMGNDFQEWEVPALQIDREHMLSAVGQLRTRVQAFIETIGSKP